MPNIPTQPGPEERGGHRQRGATRCADDAAGASEEPGVDTDESVAGDTVGATEASSVDLEQEQNVRFVSLRGLVLIPVGAGWVVGEPKFGMSVASLVLTVYQIAYNR